MAIGGDALMPECEVEFGRKANVQADRPTLSLGEIQPLFQSTPPSDVIEPPHTRGGARKC